MAGVTDGGGRESTASCDGAQRACDLAGVHDDHVRTPHAALHPRTRRRVRRLDSLGAQLGITGEVAEHVAARMVGQVRRRGGRAVETRPIPKPPARPQKRLVATIDQVEGVLVFAGGACACAGARVLAARVANASAETDALMSWDAEIRGVCAGVNACVERITVMSA